MAKKKTTTKKKTTVKQAAKPKKTKADLAREQELKDWITVVVIGAITIVAYMRLGVIGEVLSNLCKVLFGKIYFIMMALIIAQILITMINRHSGNTRSRNPIAIVLIVMATLLLCASSDTEHSIKGLQILTDYAKAVTSFFTDEATIKAGGGILGAAELAFTTYLVDYIGTIIVVIVLYVIAALLLINLDVYKQAFHTIITYLATPDDDEYEYEDDEEEVVAEDHSYIPTAVKMPEIEVPEEAKPAMRMINLDASDEEYLEPVEPLPVDDSTPRAAIDIRVDTKPAGEDKIVDSFVKDLDLPNPTEETKEEEINKSIFMSVDDLVDNANNPVEQPTNGVDTETIVNAAVDRAFSYNYDRPAVQQEIVETEHVSPYQEEVEEEPYVPSYQPVEEEPYVPQHVTPASAASIPQASPAVKSPSTDVQVPQTPEGMRKNKPYQLPTAALLDPIPPRAKEDPNVMAAQEKSELLINVLRNFDIDADLLDTHIGPAVTKFEIKPSATVKVSRILNLTDDIKMQMAVRDIRIEAPIPGRNAVGVEVPNVKSVPVKMKELVANVSDKDNDSPLTFYLGKDLLGNVVTCRLDKMPHLLIAGATGSGKSVCMNAIITSFLLRTKPDEVKLLLVDPKKVEFTPYQKIPHLIGPVINDPNQASNALKVIVKIMDERYDAFSKAGVRNIQGYNRMVETAPAPEDGSPKPQKLPYIVVIVDEMADLMAVAGKEVETSIQRITQLARAAGIHLIIATQRPSVDVITGIIKANVPSRIAFAVSSAIDSKTILDHAGAERLLGYGDMLYMPMGTSNATRIQGVFITDDEVKRITDYVSAQAVPMYDDAFIRLDAIDSDDMSSGGVTGVEADPLFEEVREYVVDVQKASTSLLQRRFGIGYNRAARMIDLLEERGIIGPQQGSKPRDVYMKKED